MTISRAQRYDLAVSCIGGKVYAVGGCDVEDQSTKIVEEYDAQRTFAWQFGVSMPRPCQYMSLAKWEQ